MKKTHIGILLMLIGTLFAVGSVIYLKYGVQTAKTDTENPKHALITLDSPMPNATISSPLEIRGKARGYWFFEASFPAVLTNWDGLIIAEIPVQAQSEWMTEDLVSFTASMDFESPYKEGDPDFMKRGTLILEKDNPSGLPEHDDAYEITVWFEATEAL
ncbi:hypothetical protein JXR01_00740 [Candidatus Kaiserbacteria bacterium]|nr:MAG: hypothetical protein JXR01_00740 [Candidatus Kaiserbacteria bacterium]